MTTNDDRGLPELLIGCSSKGYFTVDSARQWATDVGAALTGGGGRGGYICVPYPLVPMFVELLSGTGMRIGVQDVSAYPAGPYTGEVNAALLADLGVRYVMVGHPERKRHFGEGPEVFRAKIEATIAAEMVPILVCGESDPDDDPEPFLRTQLQAAFGGLDSATPVIAAYEPTWAIGAAQPAPAEHVVRATGVIRDLLADLGVHGRIVYGGSAEPGTYAGIAAGCRARRELPDGVFLGRGGLDPQAFLRAIEEVRREGSITHLY